MSLISLLKKVQAQHRFLFEFEQKMQEGLQFRKCFEEIHDFDLGCGSVCTQ